MYDEQTGCVKWTDAVRVNTRGIRWRDEEFIVFIAVCYST